MSSQDLIKQHVARVAIDHIPEDSFLGVGTGSTVNHFIDALAKCNKRIKGAVPSSSATEKRLRQHNLPIVDLNNTGPLPLYIDGADEVDEQLHLLKGGGGALTREKIIACASEVFICIVDASKQVTLLGKDFPLPIEVIPMARSFVARELAKLGGQPVYRTGFVTDNGNLILDVRNLKLLNPLNWESRLNNLTGVVAHGLFASRPADMLIVGDENKVKTLRPKSLCTPPRSCP